MKILYMSSSVGWGGMEMHPLEVADALAVQGHCVAFSVKRGSRMSMSGQKRDGMNCHEVPFVWYFDPVTYLRLRKLVQVMKPDVIHVHYAKDTWTALLLAGMMRKKAVLVFTKHIASPDGVRKNDPLHSMLVRRLDALVAISGYIKKNILAVYPIHASKVPVIYYGIGDRVIGNPEMGKRVRERLGIEAHEPLIGMVAQVTPDKRQDLFVKAAAKIIRQVPSCRFVIAGGVVHPSFHEKMRMLVSRLGLRGVIRCMGFVEDIPSLLQALNILVVPSKAEALGLVLIEAMANGCPLVASDSGAIPEVVRHGVNGCLFPSGDEDALAATVCDLLNDPDKRYHLGLEGKRMFHERFRLEREVKETIGLYESLLARR